MVNILNSLAGETVDAPSVNVFKHRIDKELREYMSLLIYLFSLQDANIVWHLTRLDIHGLNHILPTPIIKQHSRTIG